jgi:EAL and modified HD-GYP domain-containing signal transduction protein
MNPSGVLGPHAALILQLMQMVQANADVRHLEKLLKRDAILSYKLFRYINSASFGIEVEIQSLRHAVAMLGYAPLFRWLSVLLAMSSTENFSPALLQAAIVRGRLAELLGQGLLSRSESDDLFVVGMFSLLGQMLGVPVTQVFDHIVLPDAIVQALIARQGKYGPFLSLAESCEQKDGCSGDFADSLLVTARRVNDAHLSALAWAQGIKL